MQGPKHSNLIRSYFSLLKVLNSPPLTTAIQNRRDPFSGMCTLSHRTTTVKLNTIVYFLTNHSTLIGIPYVFLSILGLIYPFSIKTLSQNPYSLQKSHITFLQSHHPPDPTSTLRKCLKPTSQLNPPCQITPKLSKSSPKRTAHQVTLFPVCVLSSFAYESTSQNQAKLQNSKPLGKTSPKPHFLRNL